jgi:hypothetical protein|tara:strand:- start:304 stop:438 length:135 start_codon:yes stop_codon:yes gene_type:complete
MKNEKTELENYIEVMKWAAKALGGSTKKLEDLIRKVSKPIIKKN